MADLLAGLTLIGVGVILGMMIGILIGEWVWKR